MAEPITTPRLLPRLRRLPQLILAIVAALQVLPTTSVIARLGGGTVGTGIDLVGLVLVLVVVVSGWRGRAQWWMGVSLGAVSVAAVVAAAPSAPGTGSDTSSGFSFAIVAAITFAVTLPLRVALGTSAVLLTAYVLVHVAADPSQVRSAIDETVQLAPAVLVLSVATWVFTTGTKRTDRARAAQLAAGEAEALARSRIRAGREAQRRLHDLTIPALTSVARASIPDVDAVRAACGRAADAIVLEREAP